MLIGIMLNVAMLNVIMLSVVMLNVIMVYRYAEKGGKEPFLTPLDILLFPIERRI
jgi:hypothetical protein